MSLRRGDDAGTVKSKVISYTKMIMDELDEILDNNALEKAAELIAGARSLVIVSEGGSGTISRAASSPPASTHLGSPLAGAYASLCRSIHRSNVRPSSRSRSSVLRERSYEVPSASCS